MLQAAAGQMIVTIDGYAGSGKSSAAVALAAAVGFPLLNTGAMYRAVALALGRAGVDIDADPPDDVAPLVAHYTFDMTGGRVRLDGEDVTDELFTETMGRGASRVGTFPAVRARLKSEQRRLAAGRDMICEGRDQGTAVFPDAAVKFFFRASADVRAGRRAAQLRANGQVADLPTIRADIVARDRQDETRALDPLAKAADAIEIDTSHLTETEVLHLMLAAVTRCRSTG